jgi:hypothetical protein
MEIMACLEKQGFDWGWRTTIGLCFVLMMHESPMVYWFVPVDLGRCPRLWYIALSGQVSKARSI